MVWLCCERNTRIMLILVLCLALWNLSNSAVIETVQLSKWNGVKEWWKDFPRPPIYEWNKFTSKSFHLNKKPTSVPDDWKRYTEKHFKGNRITVIVRPFDRNQKSTPTPVDWKRLTVKPFDWDKFTVRPLDRNQTRKPVGFKTLTVKPFDRNQKSTSIPPYRKIFTIKPFDRREKSTPAPVDWKIFTAKPFDQNQKSTPIPAVWNRFSVKPFDPDKFTEKPFDRNRFRFTRKPIDRNKFTPSPDHFHHHHHWHEDNTVLSLTIILSTFIGMILVFICHCLICKRGNRSGMSAPILHAPPRRTVPPPTRTTNTSSESGVWSSTNRRPSLRELFSTVPNRNSRENNSSNIINDIDKPPSYYDVVLADSHGGQKFPQTKQTIPEMPPPQYDAKNVIY